jgi:NADH-quinone oxidoreductase subunit L
MHSLALLTALPLAGFLVNGLLGARLPKWLVASIACALPALAFVVSVALFAQLSRDGTPISQTLFTWAAMPDFNVDAAFYFDEITAVMCLIVTGIGTLIHIYSIGYMAHDAGFARYFAYLNLFLFFMLMLVLGKNLVVVFVGWEGVGLASYLLIGFWFTDPAKTAAGLKAFVVNRVGDTGFVLAAFLLFGLVGSFDFQVINAYFSGAVVAPGLATAIGLLLLLGVCGKSAQIPLHVWLPDAMAGPTPVSALIHAATMVTAGVYLIVRMQGFFVHAPVAMNVIAWIGAATALLGATVAVTQFNLKKVLAYSTISQLGLMILACGVGAFSVGLFHLLTHAFFKACLFLGAGAVLHALNGEEDMRNMGALARRLPFTFATFLVGTLALCGIPPFSGFFSKDEILFNAWTAANGSVWLWAVASAASALTAFYMFRAIFMTFFGNDNVAQPQKSHIHEPPLSMSSVLAVLAVGSLIAGFIGLPVAWRDFLGFTAPFYDFVAPAMSAAEPAHGSHRTEILLMVVATLLALAGILIAWLYYGRERAPGAVRRKPGYARALVDRGYFFDDFYDRVIVPGAAWVSDSILVPFFETPLAKTTLTRSAEATRYVSTLFARLQTGNVQAYAFYALAGLAIALWWGAAHV